MKLKEWLVEKLNPVQPIIQQESGDNVPTNLTTNLYKTSYTTIDVVRRGVDMIVNAAASFDVNVVEQLNGVPRVAQGTRLKSLYNLLNYSPNPFQDINSFRRLLYIDLVLEGNAFIYADNGEQYHLPAENVEILTDKTKYVSGYKYSGTSEILKPENVIHVKDNSSTTIYRGTTRLQACEQTLQSLTKMVSFQKNFFENSAVPGLVLETENVLGSTVKERLLARWAQVYNPKTGGRRPIILDGGLKLKPISTVDFLELDFEDSIQNKEKTVLKTLGIPPVLLDGGNNANISPNLRLFYLETVIPLVKAVLSANERYYGFNLQLETARVAALQPQLSEAGNFYSSLTNNGIITPNEARAELGWEKHNDPIMDEIREPQNIAGSASNPSEGGRPAENTNE